MKCGPALLSAERRPEFGKSGHRNTPIGKIKGHVLRGDIAGRKVYWRGYVAAVQQQESCRALAVHPDREMWVARPLDQHGTTAVEPDFRNQITATATLHDACGLMLWQVRLELVEYCIQIRLHSGTINAGRQD